MNSTENAATNPLAASTSQTIISNEHYEFLQLSQVGRLSDRASQVVDAEEQSLRQFNAELLQKVGDYRKKNLELAASENDLRTKLAMQAKQAADKERELVAKYQAEIDALTKTLREKELAVQEANDDWSRRLSKLSDESWAQGLENENLKRIEDDLSQKLEKFQQELDRAQALEEAQKTAIETLTNENHRIATELTEAEQNKVETQKAFENQNIQLAKLVESSRDRESQLVTAYEALRLEYANIDRCYNESNAALVKLQSEMRERFQQHERELQDLTNYLTEKAAQDSAIIREENAKLREQLIVRDTRLDQDKIALQTWKEQLSYLDQHLKQYSEKLKKSKSELVRMTKSLEDEVKFALANPFTEYLEMADLEISQITQQLSGISSMSPLKAKLEARLQQARAHRDGIQAILDKSGAQLQEHAKSVQALIKNLEFQT